MCADTITLTVCFMQLEDTMLMNVEDGEEFCELMNYGESGYRMILTGPLSVL